MNPATLYNRKLILFSGKGGVGKTTIASAFALSCAQRGERTLLMEMNTKDKVSSMFGSDQISTEITEIEKNLYAVNVTPEAAQEEYALMMLKLKMVYKAVFENRIMKAFLKAIPGLNELVMLGKAYYHVKEENEFHKPMWDKVIIDAPATGHGLFLLQIPQVITSILSSGHIYDEAKRIIDVMQDPVITAMVLVTLPEDMPVNETEMLYHQLVSELKVPVGYTVINSIYPPLFDDEEIDLLGRARVGLDPTSFAANLLDAAQFRMMRVEMQTKYIREVEERIPTPIAKLDFHFVDEIDFPTLQALGAQLEAQLTKETA